MNTKIFGLPFFAWVLLEFFVALPIILFLISRLSGWAALARVYRATQPFTGQRFRFQSGIMGRGVRMNNVLTLGVSEIGLYLDLIFPFRLNHPPLFIPWEDITAEEKQMLFTFVELHFRQAPNVPLRLYQALGRQIMQYKPPSNTVYNG